MFGTASRNEAAGQVAQLLRSGPPDLLAHFRQTGRLPATIAHQVLAHGISTAFQLAVAFAVLALVVALAVIQARPASIEAPTGPDNDS